MCYDQIERDLYKMQNKKEQDLQERKNGPSLGDEVVRTELGVVMMDETYLVKVMAYLFQTDRSNAMQQMG